MTIAHNFAVAAALLALTACASVGEPLAGTAQHSSLSNELKWDELTLGPNDVLRVGAHLVAVGQFERGGEREEPRRREG